MIISHRRKFAFFRTPKTGSSTASYVLRNSGLFDDRDITSIAKTEEQRRIARGWHTTPYQAALFELITLDQLREYKVFAFFRDPWERYYSAKNHGLTEQEMQKQVDYFYYDGEQIVEPLYFSHYEDELRDLMTEINSPIVDVPHMNQRPRKFTREEFWTPERIEFVREEFAEDFELLAHLGERPNDRPPTS